MEKVNKYKNTIEKILKDKAVFPNKQFPNLKDVVIINEERTNFMLLTVGWDAQEYIHQVLFHIEAKSNGKIWIHENRTDLLIDEVLIENKVDKLDIILGMVDPYSLEELKTKAA